MPSLFTHPAHLGLGAAITAQPEITGMEWYAAYAERTAADGAEGRLVSLHNFTESWDSWEMHPEGEEMVICVEGGLTLHQELADGTTNRITLDRGDYAINPRGTWHTADIDGDSATALFITSGQGTQHRPR
ncbi:cupin domain-containing protein [Stakelama tenebrarum]|uniref:Cupin domain-containing protein n=1 Tax=Stakelama tenebrarum TaxID=2711215 RepID=A0A6G6Y308_9SPHN|nr:cupin domain-containing protein [Sphingosinithalassobacter tenebrarum]QIG78956.1 cupin domain-containing protein [Sphingosinithalassobacter tenebrarum]